MKRILFLVICAVLLLCVGCNSVQKNYRDDVSVTAIAEKITAHLNAGKASTVYVTDENDLLASYLSFGDLVTDHCIVYAQQTSDLDEFGVLKAASGCADRVKQMLIQDYLQAAFEQNHEWYDSYMPQQTPKLRDAEVRVFGNYVFYCILDEAAKKEVFAVVEELLTQIELPSSPETKYLP